ncbi:TonB-dependent receptor plug domain-containing protein [Rubrivivax rivuli]|uniref:TonB-dependent receptor n=1 Tax=Rubrivivax rivuli TaxID=1862385 RepID=A0A437RAN3_9BURK|nr:TonB-dependent receptor [Rubrivivax rivuli]RVU43848.1 TonB-dependent receptor [Rubrivivax rivuli]
MKPAPITAACLSLIAGLAAAQGTPGGAPGAEDTPAPRPGARIERVEITARPQTDTDLRRRAPVAKQIYGREEIDKYGDTSVADVLKRLPGVNIQGGAPRMRGLGSGYTLILINGDPAPPGFQFDQLNPNQIERIEITRGPTADQSAQAVAGAINIILKEAPKVSQRDLRLGLAYNAVRPTPSASFTYGERQGGLSLSLPVSLFQWRAVNRSEIERFTAGSNGQPSAAVQQSRNDSWGTGINTSPRINWKISDDESASAQFFAQRGEWNNRQSYTNQVLLGQPALDASNFFEGTWQNLRTNLQWNNRFSESQRIELKAGVQHSKNTFDGLTSAQRRTVGDNRDRSITQGGKYGQFIGDSHTLSAGWELEWRQRDETRTITENGAPQLVDFEGQPFRARISRQAFFVQDEWEISPQWATYLGLRTERIETRSQGTGDAVRNISRVTTPLWHLTYKLDPKARDIIRASLTRSYKAPELSALVARPSLSGLFTDTTRPNTQASPDRRGNPALKPELATGLDIAYEKYLTGGAMFSIGAFHRSVEDLVRSVTTLETVPWATVPRFVTTPVNFSKARTTGLEFEIKGRAGELLPSLFDAKTALNLRASLNYYRSRVDAVPGPDNRLDNQQPWSGNLGFDYRFAALPLSVGSSLAYTPGYRTQQTSVQALEQTRVRSLDAFALWNFSRTVSVRLGVNNIAPLDSATRTSFTSGDSSRTTREGRAFYSANLEMKL